MKKTTIMTTLITICLSCGIAFTANASVPAEETATYEASMTASQMVSELYAMEKSDDIRRFAMDSSMILTGEKPVTDYKGRIYIGKYNDPDVFYLSSAAAILGKHDMKAALSGGYLMLFDGQENPTAESIEENKAAVAKLYHSVQEVKAATDGMDNAGKAVYIANYLRNSLSITSPVTGHPATCLYNGVADCDGASGLFYIYAMNCGLDARMEAGTLNDIPHAWNIVTIDGQDYLIDIVQNKVVCPAASMAGSGYQVAIVQGTNIHPTA